MDHSLSMAVSGCVILLVLTVGAIQCSSNWSYEGRNNPYTWYYNYPDCAKHNQSPINIPAGLCSRGGVRDDEDDHENSSEEKEGFTLYGLDREMTISVVNNGHTIQANLPKDSDVHFHIGGATYIVEQFHFHWGKAGSGKGSEHTIGRKSFPLELHVVAYSRQYQNVSDAADKRGLAVLGFLFSEGDSNKFLRKLSNVNLKSQTSNAIYGFSFPDLIGKDILREGYYRYPGSLTTPPCYEGVTWTVFRETLSVSNLELRMFRDRTGITHNYRPTMPHNGRKVTCN